MLRSNLTFFKNLCNFMCYFLVICYCVKPVILQGVESNIIFFLGLYIIFVLQVLDNINHLVIHKLSITYLQLQISSLVKLILIIGIIFQLVIIIHHTVLNILQLFSI